MTFHWSYSMLPVVILLLSIILATYFYRLLPAEVAYRFKPDGSPYSWLNRGAIILWMLIPQLCFTLLAGIMTWRVTKLGALFRQAEGALVKPERVLLVMGNMVAMPQIILCFAMLDIFSYNSYQIHILPLWVFALIVMGLGGIILGIFFIRVMRQIWRTTR